MDETNIMQMEEVEVRFTEFGQLKKREYFIVPQNDK